MNYVKKTKKAGNPIVLMILGVLFAVFGAVVLIMDVFGGSGNAVDASTIAGSDMKSSDDYYIEELVVIDGYAERTGDGKNQMYYGVMFQDANDNVIVVSLSATEGSDVYEDLEDYMVSSTTGVGDLVLSGYFKCDKLGSDSTSLKKYYKEFQSQYGSFLTSNYGHITYLDMDLTYIGETAEDYASHVKSNKLMGCIMGAAFVVLGAVMILLYLNAKKKAKALAAQHAAQMAAYQAGQAQANPYQAPSQYTNPTTNTDPADPKNWQ